jgi:hypothetical protein
LKEWKKSIYGRETLPRTSKPTSLNFQKDDEISPFAGDTGLDHAKISSIQNPLPHKSTTLENN